MVRRALFASLALAPLVIALHYLVHPDETMEFVLSAIALDPLAWLIGEATEHAAEHTGPGVGGFLNATFGNAPELIIALIAVNEGLTEVVRGIADRKRDRQPPARAGVLTCSGRSRRARPRTPASSRSASPRSPTCMFLIPSVPGLGGRPQPSRARGVVRPYLDRAPPRVRRGHRVQPPAAPHAPRRERRGGRGLVARLSLGVLAIATVITASWRRSSWARSRSSPRRPASRSSSSLP